MERLAKLMSECKCGVCVTINEHRSLYQPITRYLEGIPDIPEEIKAGMIERDAIIDIQFYPDTPVGFQQVLHWSLDKALDEALARLQLYRNGS